MKSMARFALRFQLLRASCGPNRPRWTTRQSGVTDERIWRAQSGGNWEANRQTAATARNEGPLQRLFLKDSKRSKRHSDSRRSPFDLTYDLNCIGELGQSKTCWGFEDCWGKYIISLLHTSCYFVGHPAKGGGCHQAAFQDEQSPTAGRTSTVGGWLHRSSIGIPRFIEGQKIWCQSWPKSWGCQGQGCQACQATWGYTETSETKEDAWKEEDQEANRSFRSVGLGSSKGPAADHSEKRLKIIRMALWPSVFMDRIHAAPLTFIEVNSKQYKHV